MPFELRLPSKRTGNRKKTKHGGRCERKAHGFRVNGNKGMAKPMSAQQYAPAFSSNQMGDEIK